MFSLEKAGIRLALYLNLSLFQNLTQTPWMIEEGLRVDRMGKLELEERIRLQVKLMVLLVE
jgi:hypothetical protein